ncbi:hypothetical protein [Tianweitania sp.]|uniref:hypothetical protein n=1 Tax=Tianweitania sp. TaxID=2021634 RepID=UPI0028A1740C|nr:hypothetical protein [Tianweitania sp.]
MTPACAIQMLERQLATHGQNVTLKLAGGDVEARAFVRGMKPDELTGDLKQNDRKVTLSPSGRTKEIAALDTVVIAGRDCMVEFDPDVVLLNDQPVRINLVVRG